MPILSLVIISLTILSSVAPQLIMAQTLFVCVALTAFLVFSLIDYEIIFSLHFFSFVALLILSAWTSLFGLISRGSQRWISLGVYNLQPSELIKPFLLVTFSAIAASQIQKRRLWLLVLGLLPMIIVYLQPDLGTTLVIFVGWASIVVSRLPLKTLGALVLMSLLISVPVFNFGLHDYQRQRLITFIDPYKDPLKNGYHVIQSTIAVGSGQIFGRGLGHGTQTQLKFLPEHHTDFIFASISEEMGLIGSLACLTLYGILFWRIYIISQTTPDPKASLFCLATVAMLAFQTFVNIGMNIGLAPITGITLPLLSYGGSSLLSVGIVLGLVNSISQKSKNKEFIIIH